MDGSGSRICIYVLVVLDIVLSDGWMICVDLRCVALRCGGRALRGQAGARGGGGAGARGDEQGHGVTDRGKLWQDLARRGE
jgi:hypothetical protein